MNTNDMIAFVRGFNYTTELIRRFGKSHPQMVHTLSRRDPATYATSEWFREGAEMAIELGYRAWAYQQTLGGYRGVPNDRFRDDEELVPREDGRASDGDSA